MTMAVQTFLFVAVRRLLAEYQAQEVKANGFPLVRVGMHTGPAVGRDGDWFGATVNLAARVSAAAAGGEALLTATTRTAAGEVAGVELRERGAEGSPMSVSRS
jgi:class 3 adenylate cyclase